MTVEERGFIEIDVPSFQMDRVLVACGIVDSRTNAQRLLKSNSISWRRDDGVMDWTKVTEWKQELESGCAHRTASWRWTLAYLAS